MTNIHRKVFDELAELMWHYPKTEHMIGLIHNTADVLKANCSTFDKQRFVRACGIRSMEQEFNAAEDKRVEALLAGTENQGPWITPRSLEEASKHLKRMKLGKKMKTIPMHIVRDYPTQAPKAWDQIEDEEQNDTFHARLNPTGTRK